MVKFVASCNLSFNVLQQHTFRELLELVAGHEVNVPCNKIIMRTLENVYDEMKSKLIKIISKQKYVCVTCDVWSSSAQSYLGMTLHFLTSEFKRVPVVQAFRQMLFKQTNQEITSILVEIFEDFNHRF